VSYDWARNYLYPSRNTNWNFAALQMRNKYLFIIGQLVFLGFASCNAQASHEGECSSLKLTPQQKMDNSLFLDFYYGMTPTEFASIEQQLIRAKTLGHSDSTTKFMLVVNNVIDFDDKSDNADECIFMVTPAFEGCSLYAIDLEYIPINNYVASFKSFAVGERFRSQKIPYESTVKAVEKAYNEKYGKPHVSESHSLGGNQRIRKLIYIKTMELAKG
jgi:hypothetical protein